MCKRCECSGITYFVSVRERRTCSFIVFGSMGFLCSVSVVGTGIGLGHKVTIVELKSM